MTTTTALVSLAQCQQQLIDQQFDAALNSLRQIFQRLEAGEDFSHDISLDTDDVNITAIYTQIAHCCKTLLLCEKYNIDDATFAQLILYARDIAAVFLISGFYHTGFIVDKLQTRLTQQLSDNQLTLAADQSLKRLLLCYSLYTPNELDINRYLTLAPHLVVPALLALVSTPVLISAHGYARREQLIATMSLISLQHPKDLQLAFICSGWMLCSYAARRDKHDLKRSVNMLLTNWYKQQHITVPEKLSHKRVKAKPVLLVFIETMNAKHAMYRCFGEAISALQKKFTTISISAAGNMDDTARALFHRNERLPENINLQQLNATGLQDIINQITELDPDMIYYPSIGMTTLPVLLANLRLAPVQIASLGHPATTHCPHMDYMIIPEEVYDERAQDLFSETVITVPMDTFTLLPPSDLKDIHPNVRATPHKLNIIIAEKSYKLNPEFIRVCQKISAASNRKLVFHFFVGEVGMWYHVARKEIHQLLPGAYVYPRCPIDEYISLLNQGDLFLSTFPFGSTNGAIDAACLGLPIIGLEGDEPHSRYDAFLMRQLQMPAWLSSKSTEDYVTATLRLIDNDQLRVELSEQLIKNYRQYFSAQKNKPSQFGDLFYALYEQQTDLSNKAMQIISHRELITSHP